MSGIEQMSGSDRLVCLRGVDTHLLLQGTDRLRSVSR